MPENQSNNPSNDAAESHHPQTPNSAPSQSDGKPQVVVSPRNTGVSIILTVLFGPLGMFYSTVIGGLIMTIISVIVGVVTLGFGLIVTWPIAIIWGALAARSHNNKLMR